MSGPTTIAEVEAAAADKIAALDATAHRLASGGVVTWREADIPLTASDGSALESHLLFSVTIEDGPATGATGAGSVQVAGEMLVAFLYKVPAGGRLAATRKASDAARDVVRALLAPWSDGPAVDVINAYTPLALSGDFLRVEVRFSCVFDLFWES